jgi:hypothetical protein
MSEVKVNRLEPMMLESTKIQDLKNEDLAAIVIEALSQMYFGITFEAVENGCGGYDIKAKPSKPTVDLGRRFVERLQQDIEVMKYFYHASVKLTKKL